MILYFAQTKLQLMADYKGYYLKSIETVTNFTDLGIIKLDDMGTLPFFSIHYKGKHLSIKSKEHCADTDGDCFKFTQ